MHFLGRRNSSSILLERSHHGLEVFQLGDPLPLPLNVLGLTFGKLSHARVFTSVLLLEFHVLILFSLNQINLFEHTSSGV